MCSGLRVETAMDGSFCLCKKGSPVGHLVPETMLTFCPATCPTAAGAARNAATHANPKTAHNTRTDNLIVRLLEAESSRSNSWGPKWIDTFAGMSPKSTLLARIERDAAGNRPRTDRTCRDFVLHPPVKSRKDSLMRRLD